MCFVLVLLICLDVLAGFECSCWPLAIRIFLKHILITTMWPTDFKKAEFLRENAWLQDIPSTFQQAWSDMCFYSRGKNRHWKNKNPTKSTWGTSRAFSFLCTLIKMQAVAFVHVIGRRQLKQICQTLKSKKVTSVNPFAPRFGFLTGVYVHCRQWMHQSCCCHWGVSSPFLPHLIPFHYLVFTS